MGLFAQALHCLTAPLTRLPIVQALLFLGLIETDTRLLKKKFTPGQKTGDILEGRLVGKKQSQSLSSHETTCGAKKACQHG